MCHCQSQTYSLRKSHVVRLRLDLAGESPLRVRVGRGRVGRDRHGDGGQDQVLAQETRNHALAALLLELEHLEQPEARAFSALRPVLA
jgi:hypothetical protein